MIFNKKRYSALVIGVIIIAFVWSTHVFAVFQLVNGCAYDALMRHYLSSSASEQLIVLDGDKQIAERGDELWLALLKNLLAQDVTQIVFNFLPERVSAEFYQLAADSGKVIFGQQLHRSDPYSPMTLQPLPPVARGKNILLGLVTTAPSQGGVFREQYRHVAIEGTILPTLEYLAAQRSLNETMRLETTTYRINFIGGTARIPKIKLTQAANGLVSELVAGRTVLIGLYGLDPLASYFTPLSTVRGDTADVVYHAFALDTLLAKRNIAVLPNWAMLLLIASITAATLIFCQYLTFQGSFCLALTLTLCYVLSSWLTLNTLFLWIPPVEMLLTQWLSFALVWRYRIVQENKILDSLLFNLSINLQEKAFPVSFYHSQDPWAQLIIMINQSLHLNRLIFLERVPHNHRLKEIKAFQCSIDDIVEMRRDYERTPYSTAIQEQKPILLDTPYLKSLANIDEQHYLAPLIFAGNVLGFWAFTIEPSTVSSMPKFLALAQAYMTQISEILYYRQEWQERVAQENNKLWDYLSFNTGTASYQMLNQSVTLLDRRITELQQVFNSLNTGGVLYDLFGRVLLLNKYMEELALSIDLKLYSMTALDFITAVTGYDVVDARHIMQKTIFDREMISIPIGQLKAERDYILHIQPLTLQDHNQQLNTTSPVFQITGVLCELEDVTELKAIYRLKEQLFERFSFQMRNDLAAMVFALSLFEDEHASVDEKSVALSSIHDKVKETLLTLKSVNEQMNIEIESLSSNVGRYPINGQEPLKKAVAVLSDYAALRAIKLHVNMPDLLSLVFASPAKLYSVFHTLLTVMIDDTFEGASVRITVEENQDWLHYSFRNNGIGIADNKLQQFDEHELLLSTELLKMTEVNCYIAHWQGQIDFSSQLGVGSIITLSLQRFL